MRKRGFELSINFLIVVILSIALLFMGVIFFNKILKGATDIKESYDQRTEEELEALMLQGERVAIPFVKKETRKGGKVIFGLGIYNTKDDATSYNFRVDIQCSTAFVGTEPKNYCDSYFSGGDNIIYYTKDPNTDDITIKNNERHKMPIAITFPTNAEVATYVFNVCVCHGETESDPGDCDNTCKDTFPTNLYDSVHKMYVTVS